MRDFDARKPFDNSEPHGPRRVPDLKKVEPPKPRPVTIEDLFPRIERWGIGWNPILDSLRAVAETKPSYPPYNIVRDGNVYEIQMAVAGFRKHELEVYLEERTLVVRTNPDVNFESDDIRTVIHQGIAQRNFEVKFLLAEHVEVGDVSLSDGILKIKLNDKLPPKKKIQQIEIK